MARAKASTSAEEPKSIKMSEIYEVGALLDKSGLAKETFNVDGVRDMAPEDLREHFLTVTESTPDGEDKKLPEKVKEFFNKLVDNCPIEEDNESGKNETSETTMKRRGAKETKKVKASKAMTKSEPDPEPAGKPESTNEREGKEMATKKNVPAKKGKKAAKAATTRVAGGPSKTEQIHAMLKKGMTFESLVNAVMSKWGEPTGHASNVRVYLANLSKVDRVERRGEKYFSK